VYRQVLVHQIDQRCRAVPYVRPNQAAAEIRNPGFLGGLHLVKSENTLGIRRVTFSPFWFTALRLLTTALFAVAVLSAVQDLAGGCYRVAISGTNKGRGESPAAYIYESQSITVGTVCRKYIWI
jgi:hypothetical protein